MKYEITIAIIAALLTYQKSFSQNSYNIKGKIIDYETNDAIIGATIDTDFSQNGTLSELNGNFEIKVDTNYLVFNFIGYHHLKFINIPTRQKHIDFGEIKMVQNYLLSNLGAGIPILPVSKEMKQKDKKLRSNVLKKYRIEILGKKLKPYFEGKNIIFDFDKNREK